MRVAIVGLGLIGGSLARALLRAGITPRATDTDRDTVTSARRDGIRAEMADQDGLRHALEDATVVIIAVPLARVGAAATEVLAVAEPGIHVLHAGSLQRAERLELRAEQSQLIVGTHPLAGTHESSYAAARASLFDGASVSIESRASPEIREAAESMWRAAGATSFAYRNADEHDRLMSWVSHLPQLVAVALAATLEGAGIDPRDTGTGARDTTRLAASPFPLWGEILAGAPPDTVQALEKMEATIAKIRRSLEMSAGKDRRISAIWDRGRAWKLRERRP
jgi:prephenate dehydrogenase